jgi:hypothetical protein
MKKNILFVVLCAVLLLLFTSSSYKQVPVDNTMGGPLKDQPPDSLEPQLREDPWDNLKSPPVEEDENSGIVAIIIDLGFCYILYTF